METRGINKIILTDRKHLILDGVEYVGNFDNREIALDTNMGFLALRGEGLHITELSLEEGRLVVEGKVSSLEFIENRSARGGKVRGKGVLSRIMK